MSRLGTKTYSRKPECKNSIQFDQMLVDKNKPTAAKVAMTTVHRTRWGMTSYTSLRKTHLNGQKEGVSDNNDGVKHIKVDPSKISTLSEDPFSFDMNADTSSTNSVKRPFDHLISKGVKQDSHVLPRPNKFFKSGATRVSSTSGSSQKKLNSDIKILEIIGSNKINHIGKVPVDQYSCRIVPKFSEDSSSKVKNCGTVCRSNLSNITQQSRVTSVVPSACASSVVTSYSVSKTVENTPPMLTQHDGISTVKVSNSSIQNFWTSEVPTTSSSKQTYQSENSAYIPKCVSDERFDCTFRPSGIRTYGGKRNSENSLKGNKMANDDLPMLKDVHQLPLQSVKEHSVVMQSPTLTDLWSEERVPTPPTTCANSNSEQTEVFMKDNPSLTKTVQSDEVKVNGSGTKGNQPLLRTRRIFNSPKKHNAVYNLRHWQASGKEDEDPSNSSKGETRLVSLADEFEQTEECELTKVSLREPHSSRSSHSTDPVTSVKCSRKEKELYTVIKNVKQAYQCHESGETQEFNDDIEYLLEGLQIANIGTRCLSILSLATKCMSPAFRIHLRAHGTVTKIFSALKDSPEDPSLSLCTATLMFVLSQDRLTMDLEASTLSLMLQLLESDPQNSVSSDLGSAEIQCSSEDSDGSVQNTLHEKHVEKVRQLCEQMQQKGHAKHLNLDNIKTGNLAMETLLSLTSRRAGEWFKEELRSLGGMDHLVDTVSACENQLGCSKIRYLKYPSDVQLDKIRKVDRCLRVLENVTYMNAENQIYLIKYRCSLLITACVSLLELCRASLMLHPIIPEGSEGGNSQGNDTPGTVFLSCLLSLLKVLFNLTHENACGSATAGSQQGLISCVLLCILQTPRCIYGDKRFDLLVLSLGLMINLVEHCKENRDQIINAHTIGSFDSERDGVQLTAMESLVEVFLARLEAAKKSEEQADALLSTPEEKRKKEEAEQTEGKEQLAQQSQALQADDLEETLMKALQKAGKHMEHSIIGAYIALLLGCVIHNNQVYASLLRSYMPEKKFDSMVEVLKKFLSFVSLTGVIGNTGVTSIQRVIEVLESS